MPADRTRRDIQSLIEGSEEDRKVIDDYARAIQLMRDRDPESGDPTDPLGWLWQAAIHGYPGLQPSVDDRRRWGSCRHASWFFLAWHRIYLLFFEQILQTHLQDPTWSLPYWDYTKRGDEAARTLPEPFRTPTTENPLFDSSRDP